MTDENWNSCFGRHVNKRRKRDVEFEVNEEMYNLTSPWKRNHLSSGIDEETLLSRLRDQMKPSLDDCPEIDVKKLANPNQQNYSPLIVVYSLICEALEKPGKRIRRKIYSGLTSEDHSFFMKCVTNESFAISNTSRFRSLLPIVRHDQIAFHSNSQFHIITDPVQLPIYFNTDPAVERTVKKWIKRLRDRILLMPRFYQSVGKISLSWSNAGAQMQPMEWIEENDGLEGLPVFMKSSFLDPTSNGLNLFTKQASEVVQINDPVSSMDGDVILSESVLLALLQMSSDAHDRGFEIPVEIRIEENHRLTIFEDPVLKTELDQRQKQDWFFTEAMNRSFGKTGNPRWSFSKWKLDHWNILIKKRQDLVTSKPPIPVKIFSKVEYLSEVFQQRKDPVFEVFSSEELAKYWLAMMLHDKAQIYVAHLSSKDGKRLKNTVFTSPEQIFKSLPVFLQFQPTVMNSALHSILTYLQDQPTGRYLLQYQHLGTDVCCLRVWSSDQGDGSQGCYDLHQAHEESGKTCQHRIPYIPQQWKGTDSAEKLQRIPHTFLSPPKPNSKKKLPPGTDRFQKAIDYGDL